MTQEERARKDMLFEVRVQEFTQDMHRHKLGGAYVYQLNELWLIAQGIGIDTHASYLLN